MADQREHTEIGVSRGFARWLAENHTSLAFSSYQAGRLFLVGSAADGKVSVHQQSFKRPMGLAWQENRLYLSSLAQIWRLENVLGTDELADGQYDVRLMPRQSFITGNLDVHEMAIDRHGRLVFVATDHSCLAVLDMVHSFQPIWKPPFISEIASGDRCHINGLGMADGRPKYVTAVSQTDVENGWHGRPLPNGVIIDVETDEIITDRLAMPHSPRVYDGKIYALDSGRGFLVEVNRATGDVSNIAFCPGFLRGLSLIGGYAVVTCSKPRYGTFKDLPIGDEMERRRMSPMCAVFVIDIAAGEIVEWLVLDGQVEELFTVIVMPRVSCPCSIGPSVETFSSQVTFRSDS